MDLRRLVIVVLILAGCGAAPDVHYRKGRTLHRQGKLAEALREADAGLRAEPSWRFRILKADILLSRADTKTAKELLASAQLPADPELLARLKMAQGYAEYLTSNYSAAEQLLQQAAQVAKPLGLPALEATIENRMGLVEVQQGRLDAAEQAFRHVIEVATAQNDPYLESTATGNLGFLFLNAFRFEDAIYWFEKASAKFHDLGNMNSYYISLGNLGTCYLRCYNTVCVKQTQNIVKQALLVITICGKQGQNIVKQPLLVITICGNQVSSEYSETGPPSYNNNVFKTSLEYSGTAPPDITI